MLILGIETSCDETAAAVVEDGTKIISNVVASSAEMHAQTGGIIPEQAARQQLKSILPVIGQAMKGLVEKDLDALAITVGPGLIGSLLVGVETAKTLSCVWQKPIIPVNHLVAHLYANWLNQEKESLPQFPALGLVVSGGHTDLVLIKGHGRLEWLGGTRDDAAGEAFDKTARLLDLPYPGGPIIAQKADLYLKRNPQVKLNLFPRPLINEQNFDFSFSGLKTAVLKYVRRAEEKKEKLETERIAAEVQEAIVEVLVKKTIRAITQYRPRSFLLAGGVAANQRLRQKFGENLESLKPCSFHVPNPKLCTDNASYIGSWAFFNQRKTDWKKIVANPGLQIVDQV